MSRVQTSTLITEIHLLRELYDCDLLNITMVREISLRENLLTLYNYVCDNPNNYYNFISNGYNIDI